MKIKPIKTITENEYQFYAKTIEQLLNIRLALYLHEPSRIGINITDIIASVSVQNRVNISVSARVNNEKFYFNPIPNKQEHLISYEIAELKDQKSIDLIISDLCEKVQDGVYFIHKTQADRKKKEESENKEKERVHSLLFNAKKAKVEMIVDLLSESSFEELDAAEDLLIKIKESKIPISSIEVLLKLINKSK